MMKKHFFTTIFLITLILRISYSQEINVIREGKTVTAIPIENIFQDDYFGKIALAKTKASNMDLYTISISVEDIEFCTSLEKGQIIIHLSSGKFLFYPQVSESDCSNPFYAVYSTIGKHSLLNKKEVFLRNEQTLNIELLKSSNLKAITIVGSKTNKTLYINPSHTSVIKKSIEKIQNY